MNSISAKDSTMCKAEIKASGMFGYELVEEVVANATFYKPRGERLLGILCRTSSGIRFVVDGEIYLSVENEAIDFVECQPVTAMGCSLWKYLGSKALAFKVFESTESISFAVPDLVAKTWAEHFDFG